MRKLIVHGDIKPENCVLNLQEFKLSLNNFGATRKLKERNYEFSMTFAYFDPEISIRNPSYLFRLCDDMYQFGYIISALFPEIFKIKIIDHE